MIVQGCMMVVMAAGGFFNQSASIHQDEMTNCVNRVEQYVSAHCPVPREPHAAWQKQMQTAIAAVSNSNAKTDAQALTAACP